MLLPILILLLLLDKFGVTTSILSITDSTSVSTLHKFPARKPLKCSIYNSRRIKFKEIPIPAWRTYCSNAYNLFQLLSFNKNGCKFTKKQFVTKTHLYRFQIVSGIAVSNMFAKFLALISTVVLHVVLSVIIYV